jgi:hypothetical protein
LAVLYCTTNLAWSDARTSIANMSDVGKVRRLSESSTDSEDEDNSKKDENTDLSEVSDSDSDSESSSSSSDSGSDSDGEVDLEDNSTVASLDTPGPGQQNLSVDHIKQENTLITQQNQLDGPSGCPVGAQAPGLQSGQPSRCPVTMDQHLQALRSPGVRDQSLVSPDPDMFRKSQAAFSGDLDAMELDLVGTGQSDFSNQHSFQNLLEDISTDENSDIPMMTQESDTRHISTM